MAISALIPECPFNILESVLRLTPRASAACVTVKPRGSRQSSRKISPGWGGLCIFIGDLVIVFIIHILDIWTGKLKCNAPVAAYDNRPDSLSISGQGMLAQSGQCHVPWLCRYMKTAQNQSQFCGMLCLNAGGIPTREEAF